MESQAFGYAVRWVIDAEGGPALVTDTGGEALRHVRVQRCRFASPLERFWKRVDRLGPNDCWNWLGSRTPRGYGVTRLWGPERRFMIGAHRVAWLLENGSLPSGRYVCHHCDNPPCCNPAHLFLGTPKDNLDDMYRKGRQRIPLGENRAFAKLTSAQVKEIRARCARGELQREVGKLFGVGQPRISTIVNRKKWAWL